MLLSVGDIGRGYLLHDKLPVCKWKEEYRSRVYLVLASGTDLKNRQRLEYIRPFIHSFILVTISAAVIDFASYRNSPVTVGKNSAGQRRFCSTTSLVVVGADNV
jgi:hypothetical protein